MNTSQFAISFENPKGLGSIFFKKDRIKSGQNFIKAVNPLINFMYQAGINVSCYLSRSLLAKMLMLPCPLPRETYSQALKANPLAANEAL